MNKMLKIMGIIILIILVMGITKIYNNTYWWKKDNKKIKSAGAVEKKVVLPSGNVINYGETNSEKPALLLIHGQMGSWEDYASVLPELSKKWHVYAIDVYGHGQSSHDESLYYIDKNGDDIIWFINNVIGEKTVISGHSNGAITAAYVAAYGGDLVSGVVLEDPPIFSTEGEGWQESFAYLDTYKVLHDYNNSDKSECWEAYYLRNCYWGKLFMPNAMDGIANYADKYNKKHPNEEVKIFFLPRSITGIFHYVVNYDFQYGEHFYDLSWNNGIKQEDILSDIKVPCIYLHAKESKAENGTLTCAASKEQAKRAANYIGENCTIIETSTSDHLIHFVHSDVYINAINSFLEK